MATMTTSSEIVEIKGGEFLMGSNDFCCPRNDRSGASA